MPEMQSIYPITEDNLKKAASFLHDGKLVAFATETVYGLGANALKEESVAAIFEAKQRPSFNPLIVHVHSLEMAAQYAVFNPLSLKLAHVFWPGPLTMVLKRTENCPLSQLVSAGLDTVAIRMPAHLDALRLLKACDLPIAAPSANKSGAISPTKAEHVAQSLDGKVHMILDGGSCAVGLESTVIDVSDPHQIAYLRPGGITIEDLTPYCDHIVTPHNNPDAPTSPGMLLSHYAPDLPVRLNATNLEEGEILLGFGQVDNATLNLSEKADLTEAAANLFAMMRSLDLKGYRRMAVSPIPHEGLGIAINDRLQRAAAPRT